MEYEEFYKCPTCGSEETTVLGIDIRGCKCGRNFKPSIEELRWDQQNKTKEYYEFLDLINKKETPETHYRHYLSLF